MKERRFQSQFWLDIRADATRVRKEIGRHKLLSIIAASLFLSMHVVLIAKTYHGDHLDAPTLGVFGDFVGGYFGPVFSLIGIYFLVVTLRDTRQAGDAQDRAKALEAFERRYFELLRVHHDNVSELRLGGREGRKVFVSIFQEWRKAVELTLTLKAREGFKITRRDMLDLTYCCVFFGVGNNSSRMLTASLRAIDKSVLGKIESELYRAAGVEHSAYKGNAIRKFDGHQSLLGHHYRHLYQMVRYIDDQSSEVNRYEYVKTIRAQLSTHEQALLLLNSLSGVGSDWWAKDLLGKYRLVQNIPQDFFKPEELVPETLFEVGYFESQDAKRFSIPSLDTDWIP